MRPQSIPNSFSLFFACFCCFACFCFFCSWCHLFVVVLVGDVDIQFCFARAPFGREKVVRVADGFSSQRQRHKNEFE